AFSGPLAVATTRAPARTASSIAKCPTAPAPPATSTVFPVIGPSANRHQCAVIAGTPRLAPSSRDALAGSGTAWRSVTTVHSAAVPQRRPAADIHSQTRCPTRAGSTPSPTASLTPPPPPRPISHPPTPPPP